jgi:hypothetical protein
MLGTPNSYSEQTISSSTQSTAKRCEGSFNLFLDFTTGSFVGSVTLKRKLYGQAAFHTVTDAQGNAATWTADLNTTWYEPTIGGAQYEWDVTRTSGDLVAGLGQ